MLTLDSLLEIRDRAVCLHSKIEVETALEQLAAVMNQKLADSNPVFLCIPLGGMIPLSTLLLKLKFPLEIDYLRLSSYDLESNQSEGKIALKTHPLISLTGRTVVIFDDILDSGITLQAAVDYCKNQHAKQIYTAVFLNKHKARAANGLQQADFSALTVEDYYVFGYGLDYSGYWRNLPGIYALIKNKS